MDFSTSTATDLCGELKTNQENVLLDLIKELCSDQNSKLSPRLRGKINGIISECDLKYHSSLHKLATGNENTATVLGFMHQTIADLTFDEQAELNQAFINKISNKIPEYNAELEELKKTSNNKNKVRMEQLKELKERDSNLDTLEEQESEKMELMMEWLNHRLQGIASSSNSSTELLTLKTKILDLKSKILHLQMLQNIFTETNQSIKAYSEMHKEFKDSIKETEKKIKEFQAIIEGDTEY